MQPFPYPFKRYILILFSIFCLLLNGMAFYLYRKSETLDESQAWVVHTYEVISQVKDVFLHVQDLQTGQRGFLITRKEEFLEPHKNALLTLDASLERLRLLVQDNAQQRALFRQLEALTQQHRELLSGQIAMFRANPLTASLTPEDAERGKRIMDGLRQVTEQMLAIEYKLLFQRRQEESRRQRHYVTALFGGSAFAVLALLLANGMVIFIGTRRKEAERKHLESEERFRLAIEGINDGIFDYNVAEGTVYFTPRYKEMLGYKDEEMPNTLEAFYEHLHPEDREEALAVMQRYFNRETPHYMNIFRMRHKDGSWRWIMARGAGTWNLLGKIQRLIGAHTDLTEQKESEERLRHLNAELEGFTYIASHDLRSPLVNLKGFASEMKRSVEALRPLVDEAAMPEPSRHLAMQAIQEEIPTALKFIDSSVEKMDKLTNAILELSRIGRRELKLQNVDANAIARRCLNVLHHQIQTKDIDVTLHDLPEVFADPLSLEQIFGNILDNAVKYLDPSRPGRIEIGGHRTSKETVYWIKDNGRGISEHDLQKVFEIFRRAGNTRNIPGEGMGMAYIKATLRRLGGEIWCESTPGEGSTFSFTISNHLKKEPSHA